MARGYQCDKCKQFFTAKQPKPQVGTTSLTVSGTMINTYTIGYTVVEDEPLPETKLHLCADCHKLLNKWLQEPIE